MSKERLVGLLKHKYDHFCDQCGINKQSDYIENLADYLLANGVIVPPCNVGQTVWSAFWCVRSHKVIRIEITESELIVATNEYRFNFSDFGRVVFLTRSQAEEALKNREQKEI